MNNTVISILIALGLFGVIAAIVFIDEGPPKLDFQEIVSEDGTIATENEGTSTESSANLDQVEGIKEVGTEEEEVVDDEPIENTPAESDEHNEELSPEEETSAPDEETSIDEVAVPSEENPATTTQEEIVEPEEEVVEDPVEEEPVVIFTPPSDFVLHLKFDETEGVRAEDTTGHANYGTLVNADTLIAWNGGKIDGGLFLDGQNDYVGIAHSETLNLGIQSKSYTLAFWFRSADEPGNEVQIIGKGGRSGPSPFSIRLNKDGEPSIRVSDGIDATTLQLGTSVTNGSWKHVTAIRDGNTKRLRMYIDGIEFGGLVYDTSTNSLQNNSAVLINRYEAGVNEYRYHNFALDDLRIYNRTLSNQEILDIVNEGRI